MTSSSKNCHRKSTVKELAGGHGFKKILFDILPGQPGLNRSVPSTYLLQIHGRTPLTTYATQVSLKACSLNTNDCFILVHPKNNQVWLGKGSTHDEKEVAKRIGSRHVESL